MAIRDKHGNVFKLRGPNPLVKDMADWDKSAIKLINLGWKSVIVENKRDDHVPNVVNISDKLDLYEGEDRTKAIDPREFIKEISEPDPEPQPVFVAAAVPEPEPTTVSINVDDRTAKILKERGVEYYCSPVVGTKRVTDELYGSYYNVLVYGEQFMFDAVIIDQSDLQLQFWCVKPLTQSSVVYRKNSQGGERWWKVDNIEPKTGGFLCLCVISDVNPSFD